MKTLISSLHWMRRTLAALLVLAVLALQSQAPAAQAEEAAGTVAWLVTHTAADAEGGASTAAKPSMHKQGSLDAQDPPCWGEMVHQAEGWHAPMWLGEPPPHAACPPVRPLALAALERPPRA